MSTSKGAKHSGPTITLDDFYGPATSGSEISLSIEKEEHNLPSARLRIGIYNGMEEGCKLV
ncbi:hypothetical protein ACJIZ3_002359 [Penstemon smallii]|uniref:Uncharacterized protein n=1 Tax=Penstemon smallii TaxID=265156 RepID=A0ABD3U699_9LAMI